MAVTLSGISVTIGHCSKYRSLTTFRNIGHCGHCSCSTVTDIGHYSDRTYVLRSLIKHLMAFVTVTDSDRYPRKLAYTCARVEVYGKRSLSVTAVTDPHKAGQC